MKKSTLTLFLLLFCSLCFAQDKEEGAIFSTRDMTQEEKQTLPWYGNNQFLYSLEGNSKNGRVERDFEGYQAILI